MPKLTRIQYKNKNLKFTCDVYIDKEGEFSTTIPKEVAEKLMSIGVRLKTNRLHNPGYFHAKTLEELDGKVKEAADKYSERTLIDERIIIKYAVDIACAYWMSKEGDIYPNGVWDRDITEDTPRWIEGSKKRGFQHRGPVGFEVAYEICKKKRWRFPNGEESKEYVRLEDEDVKDDEILRWLRALPSMQLEYGREGKEIEYTPDIGMFFKSMVEYVWAINENIRRVFGEEFDLAKIDHMKMLEGLVTNKIGDKG